MRFLFPTAFAPLVPRGPPDRAQTQEGAGRAEAADRAGILVAPGLKSLQPARQLIRDVNARRGSRMRSFLSWSLLLPLLACAAGGQGAGKIDRTVAKEPPYATKSPSYCLLLFGPQAKAKVWLVLDGDKLYVDRNGNGDLTEPGECFTRAPGDDFFRVPDLTIGVAGKKYSDLRVNWKPKGNTPGSKSHLHVMVRVNEHDQYGVAPANAGKPAKAPLLHFDGPLKLHVQIFQSEPLKRQEHFTRGKEHQLTVALVTKYPGVESVQVHAGKRVAADVNPVAEIEFPGKAPGAKPTAIKTQLKHRC